MRRTEAQRESIQKYKAARDARAEAGKQKSKARLRWALNWYAPYPPERLTWGAARAVLAQIGPDAFAAGLVERRFKL